ncbi:MAG: membrane lipoprotein lipid attachment site-containing protein [Chloroflexota bacterium]
MKKIIFLVLMILVLSGCSGKSPLLVSHTPSSTPDPCPVEKIKQFLEVAESAEHNFTQLAQQADMTPGEDLESIIKEMQVIETEAKEIAPSPCAVQAKSALTSYMETLIQGYFRRYSQGIGITPQASINRTTADDEFDLAISKLEYYETQMEELRNIVLERSQSE